MGFGVLRSGRLDLGGEYWYREARALGEKSERESEGEAKRRRERVSQPRLATRQLGLATDARGRKRKATWLGFTKTSEGKRR